MNDISTPESESMLDSTPRLRSRWQAVFPLIFCFVDSESDSAAGIGVTTTLVALQRVQNYGEKTNLHTMK